MDGLKRVLRTRAAMVLLIVVTLVAMAFAARAVTTIVLRDDVQSVATETTIPSPTTVDTKLEPSTSTTVVSSTTSSVSPEDGGEEPLGERPGGSTIEDDGTIIEVGDPVIEKTAPVAFSNRVTVMPGVVPHLEKPSGEGIPDDGSSNDSFGGVVATGDAPTGVFEEGISDRFTIQMSAKPNGHLAAIDIAMNNVPEGLDLRIDFGDGDTFDVPRRDIERLRGAGTITLEHRYEPTLTPQPQLAGAVAMDESREVGRTSVAFETQAEFLVSFSPLELTALDGCDLFGKGDFELHWNNDGRDRFNKFRLGEGETYVEEGFRVGIDGIRYDDDPIEVTLAVHERDPLWVHLLRFPIVYELRGAPDVLPLGIKELGTHTYPLSVEFHAGRQCNARFDFTVTYAFPDPPRSN